MATELDDVDELEEGQDPELEEDFDPASMPLGTFAAFPVSDQQGWIPYIEGEEPTDDTLTLDQTNAIDEMVKAVALCEPTARRLEVQNAWRQELMDRGFHDLVPGENFGWSISGTEKGSKHGPYGKSVMSGHYPTNVIGPINDILVSALTRDVPSAKFFPSKPGDDGSITQADAANKFKHYIADQNKFDTRVSEMARFFMTDDRVLLHMAPWADAQEWGFEDETPAAVPETEGTDSETENPDDAPAKPKRPRIRSLLRVFGKLSHKCPIMVDTQRKMAWQQIADEWDIAITRSTFPWIADKISSGAKGYDDIALDRLARCTVKMALQMSTGDSLMRDVTVTFTWLRPEMYMDDSCPKMLRPWFWKTFPKGYLAIHAGTQLALVRNEGMEETLKIIHSRTGNGQNRRSMTEAYVNPQLRVNNWVDLLDEFFRKTVPRVGLDSQVWNVDAMRASSVRVGVYEPTLTPPDRPLSDTMVQFPMPTHQPSLPETLEYFMTDLAEFLTGAMPTLSASQNDDPETLGQSQLQNGNAMGRLTESWGAIEEGVVAVTEMGVRWAARVQPPTAEFDSMLPGVGRVSVKVADLGSDIIAHAEGSANFPETPEQREARWKEAIDKGVEGNPFYAALIADPRNAAQAKQFLPPGMVSATADAVEKQQGEFEVLLKTGPIPNPKIAALEVQISKMVAKQRELEATAAVTGQVDPQMQQLAALIQQTQQMVQTLPPTVSSVPVRADGSENDAVEALVTNGLMNSPEGRRLSVSKKPEDVAAWQNLMLHWQEHEASAKAQQQKNQQPLIPKATATVAVDKLAPEAQAAALQEMGLPVQAPQVEQPLAPHEVTRKTTGVNAAGAPTEETISMSGKEL